jgi:hypothetical protein
MILSDLDGKESIGSGKPINGAMLHYSTNTRQTMRNEMYVQKDHHVTSSNPTYVEKPPFFDGFSMSFGIPYRALRKISLWSNASNNIAMFLQ